MADVRTDIHSILDEFLAHYNEQGKLCKWKFKPSVLAKLCAKYHALVAPLIEDNYPQFRIMLKEWSRDNKPEQASAIDRLVGSKYRSAYRLLWAVEMNQSTKRMYAKELKSMKDYNPKHLPFSLLEFYYTPSEPGLLLKNLIKQYQEEYGRLVSLDSQLTSQDLPIEEYARSRANFLLQVGSLLQSKFPELLEALQGWESWNGQDEYFMEVQSMLGNLIQEPIEEESLSELTSYLSDIWTISLTDESEVWATYTELMVLNHQVCPEFLPSRLRVFQDDRREEDNSR